MTDNPYASPSGPAQMPPHPFVRRHSIPLETLRSIAHWQRLMILGILLQILLLAGCYGLAQVSTLAAQIGMGIFALLSLATAVSGIVLAFHVYGVVWAVIGGIFTLIPCLGVLLLLRVNSEATTRLQEHGVTVGLLGADPDSIAPLEPAVPPPDSLPPVRH
jgi:hypothetical protein